MLSGLASDALAVQAVVAGAQDYLIKGETPGPLLVRAIRYAIERKSGERRLAALAMSDALTGLPNRALLLERAQRALDRMPAAGGRVGLLFLDLDRFKLVNDSLGHQAGDELLVAVAERLRRVTGDRGTVARFGGDEFAVLLRATSRGRDRRARRRALRGARRAAPRGGQEVFPGGSIGLALARGHDDPPSACCARRTRRCTAPSARPRQRPVRRGAPRRRRPRAAVEGDLNHALRRGELVVHYQPQVAPAAAAVAGVEALVRWRHPERGLLAPGRVPRRPRRTPA